MASGERLDTASHTRFNPNYPDASGDGYEFIFKTGPSSRDAIDRYGPLWPNPIGHHPIAVVWEQISKDTLAYLNQVGNTFTSIIPLCLKHRGGKEPKVFSPLIIIIGVEPNTITFETAKMVASHIKTNILTTAGSSRGR